MNFTYDVITRTLQKCLQYSQAQTEKDSVTQAPTYLKQIKKNTLKHEDINLTIMHSFYAQYKNTETAPLSVITIAEPGEKFSTRYKTYILQTVYFIVSVQGGCFCAHDAWTRQQI